MQDQSTQTQHNSKITIKVHNIKVNKNKLSSDDARTLLKFFNYKALKKPFINGEWLEYR